jgi:glutamyl-tRNA reductase
MADADIVITSTGAPQTILHRREIESVMKARRHRPLFLIDIAVPRDIDPDAQSIQNVYLYNIDHLEEIVRENVRHREVERARAQEIVNQKTAALWNRLQPSLEEPADRFVQPQPAWLFFAPAPIRN